MNVTTIGIDLAKNSFSLHGVDSRGKKGDAYLRALLIHGTRAVLSTIEDKQDKLSIWTKTLIERRGYKRAAVALAAKNARILWALMIKGETYQMKPV